IEGNWIGVDRTGTAAAPNGGDGIYIDAGGNHSVGMATASVPANRNVVSGNLGHGIHLREFARVYGNRVGTDAAGSIAIPNGGHGVLVENASADLGGGGERRNVISANALDGIRIVNSSCGASCDISDNVIGRNLANTAPLPNGGAGIRVQSGTFPIRTNVVADNGGPGIVVSSGAGNTISQNSTFGNSGLGIDLLGDGVTSNDPLDADTGPNDLLNFPTITSVLAAGGNLTVVFGLDVPAGSYRIEFFKNPSGADASGYGEGEVFASSRNITHPGGGTVSFFHSFAGNTGDVITATTTACTDGASCASFGSTSEFSNTMSAAATAVRLMSFAAVARDRAVDLSWRTGSELDNLGFHLYRGLSADGPWTRLNSSLIPGQGFSATGAAYAWRDSGLQNGLRYYYRLEDVDTKSVSTFHGPVSAVPQPESEPPPPAGEGGGSGSGGSSSRGSSSSSCPSWALAQLGSLASYTCETHGDPAATSFRVLSRTPRSVLVELDTEGFLTARDASGRVRALVPGFDSLSDPLAPALPLKRARLDGFVGRQARIGAIASRENRFFTGLVAAAVGYPQAVVAPDGTVQPGRREAELGLSRGAFPRVQARLAGEGFQGEDKTLALELMPLRYDASRGALVLSRRLTVRVDFAGAEPSEIGRGRLGRRIPRSRPDSSAYAFLATSQKGLHSVAFGALFPGRSRPLDLASLRLTRACSGGSPLSAGSNSSMGQERVTIPFLVLPQAASFGPGSRLFFHVDATASSTSFTPEVVYALERGSGGVSMSLVPATPD
ncbi:MAG TPA: right-handed parallel beta-helix repeat-containing protein, partial [Thermoanaerobaculia bacterium]|nr:right-handed parallel beta-helix repeat-containing protein [Thermoanaerobaculia bacterium]